MKDLLIFFAIVLALLTIVSALGGSIRYSAVPKESFEEEEEETNEDRPMAPTTYKKTAEEGDLGMPKPEDTIEPFDGASYAVSS
jgi:hypothetical protein